MVEPDPNALALADEMLAQDDVMRQVIAETVEASEAGQPREAGRTFCESWGSIIPAARASSDSIRLQTCVSGAVGVWHTHPGEVGLTQPVNSLPDMANVVFGSVDASIVPGVETADIVVAPADPEKAKQEFRQAIGADAQSAREVREAVTARRVDPVGSRRRAREALAGMVHTADTGYMDIGSREMVEAAAPMGGSDQSVCACATEPAGAPTSPSKCIETADREFGEAADNLSQRIDNLEIGSIAISAAVGNVVGEVVNRVLFD